MVGPILMLFTDGFGGFGGTAKFNRDFMQALDASSIAERVCPLPQLISHPIEGPIPESVVYDRKAVGGRFAARGTGESEFRVKGRGMFDGPENKR
jgi:hypothetical protein